MAQYTPHSYAAASGDLKLFAREYPGEGPPLLLMHGLTRNSADFEPLAAALAGRNRLIVPDQRGRGLSASDPEPANYRPDVYATDMFALLDHLGIERAALIGTSMGGLMAMVMAALQPDRVGAIILNDIGPELHPAGLARIAGYTGSGGRFATWDEAAERCKAINQDAFPDFGPADWDAFARRTCRDAGDGTVAFAYDSAIASGFVQPEGVAPPDMWPLWQSLDGKPVLLLRGALSDLLSLDTVRRMASTHRGSFVHVEVPHRGHAPLLDEPEAVAAILAFLEEHRG